MVDAVAREGGLSIRRPSVIVVLKRASLMVPGVSHGPFPFSSWGPVPDFVLCLFVGSRQVARSPWSRNLVVVAVVDPDDVLPLLLRLEYLMLVSSNLVLSSFRPKKLATHIPPFSSISSLPSFFPSFTLVFTTIHHQILRP